eukprot:TRINITY_DN2395_c0_g1_i2.p1 TRINITY_DN2395_c0_g1~~TRINITY_DN2395_c0_g1_i2.p1  ORF type:complete len:660 (-),score=76.16 TRINITY_DN2395_c0_g1_i2:43-2022(-)
MLRSAGDARPVARRSLLRMGNVFFPLAIAAPLIRFTIKSVWDLPIGSSLFPRFPSSQEPERRSSSDCTDDRLICSELLDNLTPLQSSILMQHTAVRSIGFSAIESDQKTEATERNRTSGFGRARHLEGSLVGDAASRTQGAAQTAKTKQDKWSLGDDLPMESAAATDVLVADAVKIQKFSANASAGEKSDLIDAAATDLRTVASHVETMATNSAAKGSGSAGVGKEDATVKLERSTEKQEIEKAKKISKGHVDADVAVSQIAHLPKVEISATTFLSLVETVRSSIKRSTVGSKGEIPMMLLLSIMVAILAAGAFTAHIIVNSQPPTQRETMETDKESGVLAFTRGEQLGRKPVAKSSSSRYPETTDQSQKRADKLSREFSGDAFHAQHDHFHTSPVNRSPTATQATPVDRFSGGYDVVDHQRDTMSNSSSFGEAGTAPERWLDGPAPGTSSHLEHHLCDELVIPKNSECNLYIPPLQDKISAGSVCIENVGGVMMFRANLDNSRGVGSSATSSVQSKQLVLTDAVGGATFASCTPNTSDVHRDGRKIGRVTSLNIRHYTDVIAGELYPTADGSGQYDVLMNGGWGLFVHAKSNETWRISDLKRRRLLAIVEFQHSTSPRTGPPRKERLVTIGPEVDAGLVILTVVGIDWLRILQNTTSL